MPAVQIRITLMYAAALELIKDYVDRCLCAMAFEHQADEDVSRTHCHFYLFDLNLSRPDDAIRDHLRKYLPKTDFMVGLSAGKKHRQITPEGAFIYGTKQTGIEPSLWKGLSMPLQYYKDEAAKFYAPKEQKAVILHVTEQKPDNVWDHYYEKMLRGDPVMKSWDIPMFKRWICADYLNRCRPIPRTADLNRYAFSLWMLRYHIGSDPEQDTPLCMEDVPLPA